MRPGGWAPNFDAGALPGYANFVASIPAAAVLGSFQGKCAVEPGHHVVIASGYRQVDGSRLARQVSDGLPGGIPYLVA